MNWPTRRDLTLAAALLACVMTEFVTTTVAGDPPQQLAHGPWTLVGAGVGAASLAAASAWWRTSPMVASITAVSAIGVVGVSAHNLDLVPQTVFLPVSVLAFGAAAWLLRRRAVLTLVVLLMLLVMDLVWNHGDSAVPITFDIVGPWLVGLVVQSRRELTHQLTKIADDLAVERRRSAQAAVLLERRRAARELHDLVGHAMSLVVIQAAAGRHLAERHDPSAGDSLDVITDAVRQARAELHGLSKLLTGPHAEAPGLADIPSLIDRANAAGISVIVNGLTLTGTLNGVLSDDAAHTAYRFVQEAITNVARHSAAPRMELTLCVTGSMLKIIAVNPAPPDSYDISGAGSGTGLASLRERITTVGGYLTSTHDNGLWTVTTHLALGNPHAK